MTDRITYTIAKQITEIKQEQQLGKYGNCYCDVYASHHLVQFYQTPKMSNCYLRNERLSA